MSPRAIAIVAGILCTVSMMFMVAAFLVKTEIEYVRMFRTALILCVAGQLTLWYAKKQGGRFE